MSTNLDRFRTDLKKLLLLGGEMRLDLTCRSMRRNGTLEAKHEEAAKKVNESFEKNYQRWYSDATAVVRQLLPGRAAEFASLYLPDPRRKQIDNNKYRLQDWLNGSRSGKDVYGKLFFSDFAIVSMMFSTQFQILESAESRLDSSLHDILQIARADLFDSEISSARELVKAGFHRAAGAMAGVVLEKHLAQVASNHGVLPKKQRATIADLNEALKSASVTDVPVWRNIQRLADIRNLCSHNKHREPTGDEIEELPSGVDKLSKTLL